MSIDISVVIGFRDWGIDRLRLAAQSIQASFGPYTGEVVLSDYGSADSTSSKALAEELRTAWVYTAGDPVWSRSRALNAGMAMARGRVLVSTDADMVFSPTSFERICELNDADPGCVRFLQCRDLPPEMDHVFVAAHAGDWTLLEASSRLRHRHGMGGMMAISRQGFLRIRGFDERLHTYGGEDIDFAQRAQRAGYRWHWIDDPAVRMYHMWHPPSRDLASSTPEGRAAVDFNRDVVYNDPTYVRNVPTWEHAPSDIRYAPLVTVAIVTKDRRDFLEEAVRSVLAQSVQDFEIVVVDDGGSDDTAEMLDAFGDDRIRYVWQENAGIAAARNATLDLARGEFVAVLDDDDLMIPDRLERHLQGHTPAFQGSCGAFVNFDDETGELRPIWGRAASLATAEPNGGAPGHSTWFVLRSVLAAFRYNESLSSGVDNDLMLRMLRGGVSLRHTGRVMALRRMHSEQVTVTDNARQVGNAQMARSMLRWGLTDADLKGLEEERKATMPPAVDADVALAEAALLLPDRLTRRDLVLTGIGVVDASVVWDGTLHSYRWERGDQTVLENHLVQNATWRDMVTARALGWTFEIAATRDEELAPSLSHLYSEIERLLPSSSHVVVDLARGSDVSHPRLETLRFLSPGVDRSFDLYACETPDVANVLMQQLGPQSFAVAAPAFGGDA